MELFTTESHLTQRFLAQRFLAIWLPYLPAERTMRSRFGRSWRSRAATTPPLVFSSRDGAAQKVAALDAQAERLKMRIGLGVAEARAMHPAIEIIEQDIDADRAMLEALADWCDRYTPLVALDGGDGLFLDITGCAHLFGGERAMLDDVLARLCQQGFDARAAIASTPGAAWAAARHANGRIVKAGEEDELVAPLPLSALRLDPEVATGLESVGLRVAGALMAAPRAPLVRRFGRSVTLRLDQALGHVREPVSPRLVPPLLSVERRFFDPVSLLSDIEDLVPALARQLRAELERREEGARHLELQLFRVDGEVARVPVLSSQPLRDPSLIGRLFREKLGAVSIDPGYGFDLVRLAVLAASPFDAAQARLDAAEPDRSSDLALFADRMRARFGPHVIGVAEPAASHLPERAAKLAASPARGGVSPLPDRERPLRLFEHAETVDVTAAEIPDGPPGKFRWRNVAYHVVGAEGPERIEPEWWRTTGTGQARDYFRIEDNSGRRFWLYREGQYGASDAPPRWYMQGMFA